MKKLLLISIILIMFSLACNKENNHPISSGIITGPDIRSCPCCGGWFIEINDSVWLFKQLPQRSNIDLWNETFPIEVELSWHKDADPCLGNEILISFMRKK